MKKFNFSLFLILATFFAFSQVPNAFNYQAVVRNSSGEIISNQSVSFKISILENSESGTVVYSETHTLTTNAFGLVNFEIGNGDTPTGTFSSTGWGAVPHFVKIEFDPAGGTAFTELTTNKLAAVPYAFTAENVVNDAVDDADADPANEIQQLTLTGTLLELSNGGGSVTLPTSGSGGGDNWGTQTVKTDATISGDGTSSNPLSAVDGDVTNELQTISKSDNLIELSDGGGTVTDEVDDADADTTNELQQMNLSGTILTLSKGGGSVTLPSSGDGGDNWGTQNVISDASLTGEGTTTNPLSVVADGDGDNTNEIQTLTKSGNSIILSNDGGTVIDEIDDADADPANEIQQLSLNGTLLELSDGGGSVTLPTSGSGGGDNWGVQTVETDATLTGNGTSTNPLSVDGELTDNQTLSLSGNDLSITGGNSVSLPNNSKWDIGTNGISHLMYGSHVGIGVEASSGPMLSVMNTNSIAIFAGNNDAANPPLQVYNQNESGAAAFFRNKIIIQDGTQGAGKVLTSDANGNSSWQTPATSSSLWTESGSNIYRSSGNVGIGTTNPQNKLHIKDGGIQIDYGSIKSRLDLITESGDYTALHTNGNDLLLTNWSEGTIAFSTLSSVATASERLTIAAHTGLVSIKNDLEVNGSVSINGGTPGDGKVLTSDADGNASWQTPATSSSLWTESGSNIYRSSGNVGIGTTTPSAPLEIKSNNEPSLIIGSASGNSTTRPGIKFINNTSQYIAADDGSDEIFGFYSKWGNTRTYDAKLRVYGKTSGSWGKYMEFTHDGTNGKIRTDTGDITISPASKKVKIDGRITSSTSGNDADLKAYAYGTIKTDGTKYSGTNNFTIDADAGTGVYKFTFDSGYGYNVFTTVVTVHSTLPRIVSTYASNGVFVVKIFTADGETLTDSDFSFVTYKK